MKFLCVECNEQMRLVETAPPDPRGSLSVRYGCPLCSRQIRLLTNPWETEVVNSLGVRIGVGTETGAQDEASGCPFGDLVRKMEDREAPDQPVWTPEARDRLRNIPELIRPMARQGIEHFAKEQGYREIDEKVLDEARERFGM